MYRFALAALFCSAVMAPSALSAQTYPSKPIHFILPYVPGGIIDNRPGAGSNIGTEAVVHAAPDGYTLLMVATSAGACRDLCDAL